VGITGEQLGQTRPCVEVTLSGEFDDHPPEARGIEPVGGAGGVEPNIEKVVALQPDVLLTAFIGGEWKDRLRDLGVPVFTTLASSFDDALADIESLGRLLGAEDAAADLAAGMLDRFEAMAEAGNGEGIMVSFLRDFAQFSEEQV